jgi:hypothetical protein
MSAPSQEYSSWKDSDSHVSEDLQSATFSGQEIWVYCSDGG